ncbi:MAG: glycosyltransferase involved in cell wall biosynthesis [Roseivirga sp.]|jgi:glycosyltransferase involved in cell wall biosynthesis
MKIVQVHNFYQNLTGDDSVVQEEYQLLTKNGHQVHQFLKHNTDLKATGLLGKVRAAANLRNSAQVGKEFGAMLKIEKPDIVHVHNIFPLITPIVFQVCQEMAVPVIQTLHNYRLLCVNTLFYRDGHICDDCLIEGSLKPGVTNRCYKNSYVQSALLSDSISFHFRKGTWANSVDQYFCLSEFAKEKFIQGGIPKEKLSVKANFVDEPINEITYESFILFAGKLEEQKGLLDFIELAKSKPEINFKVAGFCDDTTIFASFANVEYLGEITRDKLMEYMSTCQAVLFLSKMYEGMPMTILEAFAHKKAVVARNQGAMKEMIDHGQNGLLFSSFGELSNNLDQLIKDNRYLELGDNAFTTFRSLYSSDNGYHQLVNGYQKAIIS